MSLRLAPSAGEPLANTISECEANGQSDCSFQHVSLPIRELEVTINSHQTYMSLTDALFDKGLFSIFTQCCEKGTREKKLGPLRYWWAGTAGELQLRQSTKYS
jgi:hypothetical protein